jgi:hypothetical protein
MMLPGTLSSVGFEIILLVYEVSDNKFVFDVSFGMEFVSS